MPLKVTGDYRQYKSGSFVYMKKNLILLINEFPYGTFEPYMENEIEFYKEFKHIYLASMQLRKEHMKTRRQVAVDNISFCDVLFAPKWVYLLCSVFALSDKNFYGELIRLLKAKEKKHLLRRIVKLFIFVSRAHYEFRKIKKFLAKENPGSKKEEGIIYSYRFEYQAYVALLLKKIFPTYKVIARAHGFDLHEFRRKENYIPMREYLLKNLDKVVCISEDGKEYLQSSYPSYEEKIKVMRLGCKGGCFESFPCKKGIFSIVTCSAVVEVKRLDLLAKTLAKMKEEICWVHYGEGKELDKLKSLCKEILPANIKVLWKGHIDNKVLVEQEYRDNYYHLFINVSSMEGIPVSIMEAFSYGIPAIATRVGGNPELVSHGCNGILIDKDFSSRELAGAIIKFYRMDREEYLSYREEARKTWCEKFDSEKQYKEFIDFLNAL